MKIKEVAKEFDKEYLAIHEAKHQDTQTGMGVIFISSIVISVFTPYDFTRWLLLGAMMSLVTLAFMMHHYHSKGELVFR